MKKKIYTIGYTTFDIDNFIKELKEHKITCLVDVRSSPRSSYYKDFDSDVLEIRLKNGEIANKFENTLRGASAPSREKKSELKTKQQRDEKFQMAWEKWTEEEESRLVKEFNQGFSIDEIASMHNRKEGGIRARLKRLGLIE